MQVEASHQGETRFGSASQYFRQWSNDGLEVRCVGSRATGVTYSHHRARRPAAPPEVGERQHLGIESVFDHPDLRIDAPCLIRQGGSRHQAEIRSFHDPAVRQGTLLPLALFGRRQFGDEVNAIAAHQIRIENQVVDVETNRHSFALAPIQEPLDCRVVDASVDDDAACIHLLDVAALKHIDRHPASRRAEALDSLHGVLHPIEMAPAGGIAGYEQNGRTS